MKLFGFSPAAVVLALVLGPLAEEALRQTLTISRGSFAIFIERPMSLWIVGDHARDHRGGAADAAVPAQGGGVSRERGAWVMRRSIMADTGRTKS